MSGSGEPEAQRTGYSTALRVRLPGRLTAPRSIIPRTAWSIAATWYVGMRAAAWAWRAAVIWCSSRGAASHGTVARRASLENIVACRAYTVVLHGLMESPQPVAPRHPAGDEQARPGHRDARDDAPHRECQYHHAEAHGRHGASVRCTVVPWMLCRPATGWRPA